MKHLIDPVTSRFVWALRPLAADSVVIFVHGLDGHIAKTWGPMGQPGGFIDRLRLDLPQLAVAAYDYPSTLRAIVADRNLTLQSLADQFAQILRQSLFPDFQKVTLIAHCLGGLLCTMALRNLVEAGDLSQLQNQNQGQNLQGPRPQSQPQLLLFLLDAPHDLPLGGPSQWLAGLLGALSLTPAALSANADFWRQTVLAAPDALGSVSKEVSAYAIVSTQPSWVSHLSPELGLPAERILRVDLPHEALTRVPMHAPATAGAEVVANPKAGPLTCAAAPYDFILAQLRRHWGQDG